MKRLLLVTALVAGLFNPAASASAPLPHSIEPPPPGVGIRLVDAPVDMAEDPRAQVYIVDHVEPGTTIERRVEVSNGTDSTKSIAVYPGAADIADGTFTGGKDRAQNELSQWISVLPTDPELEPDERTMVDVTIEVPPEATRGEHYGVVWAEMVTPPEDAGVTQVSRVGIRIYLSIGPGGAPPTDFSLTSVTASRDDEGNPLVQAMVRNTGERALDLTGELSLTEGPGGLAAGPFTADPGTTLGIGDSGPVTVILDKQLPNGPWEARITASSGMEERTAEATITFPDTPRAAPAVPTADNDGLHWWALAIAAALLLLLAYLLVLALRRGRDRPPPAAARPGSSHAP